jgi:hypothetical protein
MMRSSEQSCVGIGPCHLAQGREVVYSHTVDAIYSLSPREASLIAQVPLPTVQKAISTAQIPSGLVGPQKRRKVSKPGVLALALARATRRTPGACFKALAESPEPDWVGAGAAALALAQTRLDRLAAAAPVIDEYRREIRINGRPFDIDDFAVALDAAGPGEAPSRVPDEVADGIRLWVAANPRRGRPKAETLPAPIITAPLGVAPGPMRVTARHIEAWAPLKSAQADLPILLRRLINHAGSRTRVDFPGGDSTSNPGWDGVVVCGGGGGWLPAGRSYWEVSCEGGATAKANRDIDKRIAEVPAAQRRSMTYVHVTARRWSQKRRWARERADRGDWKAVIAFDADDLEQWLEQAPPVQAWFAEQLGQAGHGIESAARHWSHWADQCMPRITVDAILAGREIARAEIEQRIARPDGGDIPIPFAIRADSIGEATAFAAALILSNPLLEASAVFVTAAEGWRFVEQNPLIRIAVAASPEIAEKPVRRAGLTVIIPFAQGDVDGQYSGVAGFDGVKPVTLARPSVEAMEKALEAIGMEPTDARRLAKASGRSWSVVRRHKASSTAVGAPGWLGPDTFDTLATICLLGSWSAEMAVDREIVARVSGLPYETVEKTLLHLARVEDTPVVRIGPVWKAKSGLELLDLAGPHITSAALQRFLDVASELLSERDPELDLDPEKRRFAAIWIKRRELSGLLRRAICDTLIKLAVRGPMVPHLAALDVDGRVDDLVRAVLHEANEDRWLSLADTLPALAEAAPTAFLAAIWNSLGKDPAPVERLITATDESGLMGRCWHASLLWALESLAWAPDRVASVALILARLSRVPIKGNWVNRPSNSLLSLFRAWLPQTAAPVEKRIELLDTLIANDPDAAASLLDSLVNSGGDVTSPSHRPAWRDDDAGVPHYPTDAEWHQMVVAAADRQISHAAGHADRLAAVIGKLDMLTPAMVSATLKAVNSFAGDDSSDDERITLRNALREKIHWHINYGEDRKFPALAKVRRAYDALAPRDLVARHRWLFSDANPSLPDRQFNEDFSDRQGHIEALRKNALQEILDADGMSGVLRVYHESGRMLLVGWVLADLLGDQEAIAKTILKHSGSLGDDDLNLGFISGMFYGGEIEARVARLNHVADRARAEGWSDDRLAALLARAPENRSTWDVATRLGGEVDRLFWSICRPNGWGQKGDDLNYMLRRLLEAKRPMTAISTVRFHFKELEPASILEMLDGMLRGLEDDGPQLDSYRLAEALDRLEESGAVEIGQLARLEFAMIRMLGHDPQRHAKSLFKAVVSDPTLFVELLTMVYKDEGPPDLPNDRDPQQAEFLASNAWHVLHHIHRVPGQLDDGSIDPKAFKIFMDGCREQAAISRRRLMCDMKLGEVLAYAPADADGRWPCAPVRDYLDRLEMGEIRRGLTTGIINKRGVYSKGADEGGAQERSIARRYRDYAGAIRTTHLHLAVTLEEVARRYEDDAEREDVQSRLRREGI